MTSKPLNNRIKVYRAINDWTQEELARQVSVTRKTINTVENGKCVPSVYLALKIARAFGVPVEELFQIDDETVSETLDIETTFPQVLADDPFRDL
jgi:putative transcriptional regulator